jgi:hypothetical protein
MSAPQPQPPYPLIDGFRRTPEKEKEINQLVGHALGDAAGEALLDYLKSITINAVCGPEIAERALFHLEGQRFIVSVLMNRLNLARQRK